MQKDDIQLGQPGTLFKDTKANIEAMSAAAGMEAFATDLGRLGICNGTAWSWINAATIVYLSANQSLASSTSWTAISWSAAIENTLGAWSSGNPTQLVAPAAGLYAIVGCAIIAKNTVGQRGVCINHNSIYRNGIAAGAYDNSDFRGPVVDILPMGANEWVELRVYQNSGSTLNILGSNWTSSNHSALAMVRLY